MDLIIKNGHIYTGDDKKPYVSCLGINNGKFVYVGDSSSLMNSDIAIDLKGAFVIPGITDGHCHLFAHYLGSLMAQDLTGCTSVEDYIKTVRKYIDDNPDMKLYGGRGWVNSRFENMCPTSALLEGLCDDKPICLRSNDGHSLWVNRCLLEMARINRNTPDIPGGKIEKDENGEPNGCIRDAAMRLIFEVIEDFSVEQYKTVIQKGQEYYASLGYTGYLEALINENYNTNLHQAYKELEAENKLILHAYANYVILPGKDALDHVKEARDWMDETKGKEYEVTSVKMFVDGVVEGKTALLKDPYVGEKEYRGADRWIDNELFEKTILKANELNVPIHVHSIGDAATFKTVTAIAKAQKESGQKDLRHTIAHLQIVDKNDIETMAKENITALFNPWANKEEGFFEEAEVPFLGKDRAENEYLVKSFFDKGISCSFGTDFPLDPLCHPFRAMQVFVERMNNGDPDTQLNSFECIDAETALKMMTAGTAYQVHKEDIRGSIEIGKDADFLVLSQNPLRCRTSEIKNTEVLMTFVKGKTVFTKSGE